MMQALEEKEKLLHSSAYIVLCSSLGSIKYNAADGDVILTSYGESTEYSQLGRVYDDIYDRLSSVL